MSSLPALLIAGAIGVATPQVIVHATDLAPTAEHDYEAPVPGSYQLPVIEEAADGDIVEANGVPRSLRELTRGRITVMSFIYTRCASAKACPYATGVLRQLHRISADEPGLAENLRLVSLSFDPRNDTPQRMAEYAKAAEPLAAAADWHFITTRSPAELAPILESYDQAVGRRRNPGDPQGPLHHTLRVYLIDRSGKIRNIYSSGTLDVRLVLADIRTLLLEHGAGSTPDPIKADADRAASDVLNPAESPG
jgi:cytochrome oxidase Cu insertion factor (SCO1/SenC/PrrC family)